MSMNTGSELIIAAQMAVAVSPDYSPYPSRTVAEGRLVVTRRSFRLRWRRDGLVPEIGAEQRCPSRRRGRR